MDPFWFYARKMLHDRVTLMWAVVFAGISAVGLGVGLLSLGPMLSLILREEDARSLPELANEFNAAERFISIPPGLIDLLPAGRFEGVVLLVSLVGVLTVLGATANFLHQYFSMTVVTKTVAAIRRDVFRQVIHMPLGRVVSRGPSDFIARITRDAAELQKGFLSLTSKAVAQVLKGVAAFAAAVIFEWRLTLVALVVAPILAVTLRKLGKRIRRGTHRALKAQEDLLRITTESLHGLRAVKANTAERDAARRFYRMNRTVIREELKVRTARALSGPIVETLAIFVVGGLAIVAAKQIIDGSLPFETFLITLGALAVSGASFKPLAGLVNELQAASAPAGRLLEITNEPREVERGLRRPAMPRHERTIRFEGISFTYPGAMHPAIRGVDLRIEHGERIAIVGPNGCGKTTLLSFVPRLLSPDAGRVLIDDIDVATVNIRSLRRQIGVVTQETIMIRGTVAENIAFGMSGVSREDIVRAAERAHADGFIAALPDGYDTPLLELGASLSGGQRQRLAIARAILRDPAILILDEATSQIDSESESLINAALESFCVGRTALLIAHRLSTVLNADRIIVMESGEVIDQGPHEELLARCGLYQRLCARQLIAQESSQPSAR